MESADEYDEYESEEIYDIIGEFDSDEEEFVAANEVGIEVEQDQEDQGASTSNSERFYSGADLTVSLMIGGKLFELLPDEENKGKCRLCSGTCSTNNRGSTMTKHLVI